MFGTYGHSCLVNAIFIAYVVRLNQRESVLMESSSLQWLTKRLALGMVDPCIPPKPILVYLFDLIVGSFFFFLFLLIQIKYALCINVSRKNFLAVPITLSQRISFSFGPLARGAILKVPQSTIQYPTKLNYTFGYTYFI